jgi:hypothetical protein
MGKRDRWARPGSMGAASSGASLLPASGCDRSPESAEWRRLASVLLISRRVRVPTRRDRVLTSDTPVPAVSDPFAAAGISQDLSRTLVRFSLRVVARTGATGTGLLHDPIVSVSDHVTLLIPHFGFLPQNVCSAKIVAAAAPASATAGSNAVPAADAGFFLSSSVHPPPLAAHFVQ